MDIQILRNVGINLLEELELFLVTMTGFALGENLPGGNIESRE